jgi:cytochrome c
LSTGRNGNLVQWDLKKGTLIKFIRAHDTLIWALKFTPDGRFALSGSSDESIRVWHLESGDRIGIPMEEPLELKPWLNSDHPGASLFKKCAHCHSISTTGANRSGPHLANLFGRDAGSVSGYNYSRALTGVGFKWNEETIFQLFNQGPDKFLPGTKMPVQKVSNTKQLNQLVEYLKEITRDK